MKMRKSKTDYSDIGFLFYIFTAAITVILFISALLIEKPDEKPEMFADGWFYDSGMTVKANLKRPELQDKKCSFYAYVPYVNAGDCLWFKAKNAFISVKVGNEERANITEGEAAFLYGKTPGTDWVCVPLETTDVSKIITIDFSTNYDDHSAYIDSVYIGNTLNTVRFALSDRTFGIILCVLIMFAGVALVIVYAIFRRHINGMSKEPLYLGVCIFFAALWSLSELRAMQLFTDKNAGLFHNLTCMTLMLIFMPLIYCYKDELNKRNRLIIPVMTVITIMNFAVSSVLHFSGIADFHETLILTHITIGIGAVCVVYASYLRCFKDPDRTKADIPPAICMILVGVAAILDIFRYSGGGINDSSFYSRIAIFAYSASLGIRSLLYVADMAKRGMESDIISRLAYQDGLTGLGNRTAYSEKLETLGGEKATVFVFDINDLKYVNDNIGHQEGDKLIKSGADIINTLFGPVGDCYRIGGDEFVCIVPEEVSGEEYSDRFYRRIEEFNYSGKLDFPIMIALGYEFCDGSEDIKETIGRADHKMYEKKEQLKKERALKAAEAK